MGVEVAVQALDGEALILLALALRLKLIDRYILWD